MEKKFISLSYLETLSTADLILLADEYGVDFPEDLSRRFIISELFDIAREAHEDSDFEDMESTDKPVDNFKSLPETYNETKIDAVMRNTAWAYVFWDISVIDKTENINNKNFSQLILNICFLSEKSEVPVDSFELTIFDNDKAQYILLPSDNVYKEFFIELLAEFSGGKTKKLATSRKIEIPEGIPPISLENLSSPLPPIIQLSGMRELMKSQYNNSRRSF
ncbi:MAG: DUF4912 domain-containing protein [Treponemataceae bacterium]